MEFIIQHEEFRRIRIVEVEPLEFQVFVEFGKRNITRKGCGKPAHPFFDHQPEEPCLLNQRIINQRNTAASLWDHLNDLHSVEVDQSLPYRSTGQSQLFGNLIFAQHASRSEFQGHDIVLDDPERIIPGTFSRLPLSYPHFQPLSKPYGFQDTFSMASHKPRRYSAPMARSYKP